MKYLKVLVLCSPFALGACANSEQSVSDATRCAAALFALGTSSPETLALAALATPACQGLAADVINGIVNNTAKTQMARGVRR